jgi:hypothetical protein
LAVVVLGGRSDLPTLEDTLTGLAAQPPGVRRVLVTTRAARRLVTAFGEPGWEAERGDPRRWLSDHAVAGGVTLATVLQAGDVPFGHWAVSLLSPSVGGQLAGSPAGPPVSVFGRVAHQPADRKRDGGLLATGPAVVAVDERAAAVPVRLAARLPTAWWRAARRSELPAGTPAHEVEEVLLLRRIVG